MFRMLVTLARGAAAAADEDVADRTALLVLDQQIREAAAATERGRRALAFAVAHDESEARRLEATLVRIADLEERAVAALEGGREDLASEAAETIAMLETDRDAITEARADSAQKINNLKTTMAAAGRRLAELERGRRLARASDAVRALKRRGGLFGSGDASLEDAEATLRRVRERQGETDAVETAIAQLGSGTAGDTVASRLEAAGFGKPTRSTSSHVLDRLKQRAQAAPGAAD